MVELFLLGVVANVFSNGWFLLGAVPFAFGFIVRRWWSVPLALVGWIIYTKVTPSGPLEPGIQRFLMVFTSAIVVGMALLGVIARWIVSVPVRGDTTRHDPYWRDRHPPI